MEPFVFNTQRLNEARKEHLERVKQYQAGQVSAAVQRVQDRIKSLNESCIHAMENSFIETGKLSTDSVMCRNSFEVDCEEKSLVDDAVRQELRRYSDNIKFTAEYKKHKHGPWMIYSMQMVAPFDNKKNTV